MTQEKILDKLQKIKNMAEGAKAIGNEAEAQAFAAMLQKLLLQHKLSLTDIEYAAEMKDEPIVEQSAEYIRVNGKRVYKDFPDVEIVERRRLWAEQLAAVIASAYASRILVSEGWSIITFVGHRSNVAICEFLFLTLLRSADKMSTTAAKSFRAKQRRENGGAGMTDRGFRESWLEGFVTRIAQRLTEERNQFGGAQQCTALVRVNKEALAVKNYVEQMHTKMAKHIGRARNYNHNGYLEGKKAADNMNIKGNAMNGGDGPNKQLR